MGGEESEGGNSEKIVKSSIVVLLVLLAGVLGYFIGIDHSDTIEEDEDHRISEQKTVFPSNVVRSTLVFDVLEETNWSTEERVQFIHVEGQVTNDAPFFVHADLELRVYYSFERNGTEHLNLYSFDASSVWRNSQLLVGSLELDANESQQVDWLFEAVRAPVSEWWRTIQAENATYFYGFPAYRHDDNMLVRPCSTVTEEYTPAPTPEFASEFSITVMNEWPNPSLGALVLVRGFVYNYGPVQGSCVLRWQFNDSREWTDEDREFDIESLESKSVERWYGNPWYGMIDGAPDVAIDDASIRLNHWVITLW